MTRDESARALIRKHRQTPGAVEDQAAYAAAALKAAWGYAAKLTGPRSGAHGTRPAGDIDQNRPTRAVARKFRTQVSQPAMDNNQSDWDRLRAERSEYMLRIEIARLRLKALLADQQAEQDG